MAYKANIRSTLWVTSEAYDTTQTQDFCMRSKDGTREGSVVTQMVTCTWLLLVISTMWANCSLCCTNGLRKCYSHLLKFYFLQQNFWSLKMFLLPLNLDYYKISLLVSRCGLNCLQTVKHIFGFIFGHQNFWKDENMTR